MEHTVENDKEHRVSVYTEEVLQKLIARQTQAPELARRYERYCHAHRRAFVNKARFTTYESLDELLTAIGISYREFLTAVNRFPENRVAWHTEAQERMAYYLDAMPDSIKTQYRRLFRAMLPENTKQVLLENDMPDVPYGLRITNVLSVVCNEDNFCFRLFTELGLQARWKQKENLSNGYTCCPHEILPAISQRAGSISLHWLLGCRKPVLARTETAEEVMDIFCFLPPSVQETVESGMAVQLQAGGVWFHGE